MDRARAIATATQRVLRRQLDRVARGDVPGAAVAYAGALSGDGPVPDDLAEQYLAKEAKRNAAEIGSMALALMNGPAVTACCQCTKPSTAIINSDPYCDDHAASARRLPRPAKYNA